MNDLSLNDVIRCTRMFHDIVNFVKSTGLSVTCPTQPTQSFRLLDDDFEMLLEDETQCEEEQSRKELELDEKDACKFDMGESVVQAVSFWSSKMESHLGKGS